MNRTREIPFQEAYCSAAPDKFGYAPMWEKRKNPSAVRQSGSGNMLHEIATDDPVAQAKQVKRKLLPDFAQRRYEVVRTFRPADFSINANCRQ
jgi:hypothetical protein